MIIDGNISKEKSMSKYDAYYFWENLIHKEEALWEGGFRNIPLTEKSLFIYTVLMDHNKDFLKNRWAYYPDAYGLLGFIQYVFLPTCYFTWLDDQMDGYYIPLTTGEELLRIMEEIETEINKEQVEIMKKQLEEIKGFWHLSEEDCLDKILQFALDFNEISRDSPTKLIYFKVFKTPTEIGQYVISGGDLEEEVFSEVIEEEIQMTEAQWKEVYEGVYKNAFMRKKFVDVLNYKIGCLV